MCSKKIKMITILASFLTVSSCTFDIVKAQTFNTTRLGGQDRYETSANIAKHFDNLNSVVIVSGEDYHDAISSCVFAKKMGAAILLTESNTLSKSSLNFLNNSISKDKKVYVVGNTNRVSSTVENALKNAGFNNIERISGQSDYDTNSAVLDKMNVAEGTPVIIVSGVGYADGISISSIAAAKGYPILMVDVNSIASSTAEELKKIKPSKIYFVGGTGVISQANRDNITSIAGVSKENIVNLSGADRYGTNLNVINEFKLGGDTVALAYGGEDNTDGKFADTLAGTAYAASKNAPILLVNDNNNKLQKQFIDSMKYSNALVYGGTGSISDKLLGLLISNSQQSSNNQPTYELNDIGKMFNADIKPDPGSSINYVTQAWRTANVYGKDMTNPNFNQSKADMISSDAVTQDAIKISQFVFDKGAIKTVNYPIAGDGFLLPFTYGLNCTEDQAKFLNAQYYSIANRFLSQSSSSQKIAFEDQAYLYGTEDKTGSQGVSFSTDEKLDFFFGTHYRDAWKDFPDDFKKNFDGCVEFLFINNLLSQDRLDSLKSCMIGAFGNGYGNKIYDLVVNCAKGKNLQGRYSKYTVDGITVIYDSVNWIFGFK